MREKFRKIADGLAVAPALAELERVADHWLELYPGTRLVRLLDSSGSCLFRDELPSVWSLIDTVRDRAARRFGDRGRIGHARIGLMRPGEKVVPHRDQIDGVASRRYQIPLRAEPGVAVTVGGETRCLLPGEAWQLDVASLHWVVNGSAADRITILFDTEAP